MENAIPGHNQLWNCPVWSATQPEVTVYLLQMNCFKIEKYSSNLREKFFPSLLLAQCGKMISKEAVICTNSQAIKRYISTIFVLCYSES